MYFKVYFKRTGGFGPIFSQPSFLNESRIRPENGHKNGRNVQWSMVNSQSLMSEWLAFALLPLPKKH